MVCCSLSGILWQLELVEGKDAPSTIIPKFNNQGKMVGLLLQMLEPIFERGNVVVLNSGFCVLKGIVELKRHSVCAFPLMKKQKYWPKHIKGELIKEHFNNKLVGDCDSWKSSRDKVNFHVYAMKEPVWDQPLQWQEDKNAWMTPGPKNKPCSTTLKWWEIPSYTITP